MGKLANVVEVETESSMEDNPGFLAYVARWRIVLLTKIIPWKMTIFGKKRMGVVLYLLSLRYL